MLEPRLLNLREMYRIYRRMEQDDISSIELLQYIYPDTHTQDPDEIMALTIQGLYANGYDNFTKFIKGMTHAD